VRLWDRETDPAKVKLHICVDPERQLFLRINSKDIWRPHHKLVAIPGGFLHHDSYVELRQLIRHMAYEIGRPS
jgi:hypothetical protein